MPDSVELMVTAIQRLRPGAAFVLRGNTLDGLRFQDSEVEPVGPEELTVALTVLQAEQAAVAYRAQRAAAYPPIGDQLDALFKAGAFPPEMAARIQAVKDEFPKPQ